MTGYYTEQLNAVGQTADAQVLDLTERLAMKAAEAGDARAAQTSAEARAAEADQLVAQLRAELAALNVGHRPAVLVPGFTDEVFYDPFTTLDDDAWNVHVGTLGPPREEFCRRENLRLVPEGLAGDTKREAFGGRSWTSWYLRSDGKTEFGLGHLFETEVTLPPLDKNASGLWAAPLWLRSTKKPGELDGAEAYGFPNVISDSTDPKVKANAPQMLNSFSATTHNDTMATGSAAKKTVIAPPGGTLPAGTRHRFGILADQTGVTYFLDGKPVPDIAGRPNPMTWEWLATKGILKANFDGPLHMRMQMQVGSPYWGPSRASTVPLATTLIHWVRVSRRP